LGVHLGGFGKRLKKSNPSFSLRASGRRKRLGGNQGQKEKRKNARKNNGMGEWKQNLSEGGDPLSLKKGFTKDGGCRNAGKTSGKRTVKDKP